MATSYRNGSILNGNYTLTLPTKIGTFALTSDVSSSTSLTTSVMASTGTLTLPAGGQWSGFYCNKAYSGTSSLNLGSTYTGVSGKAGGSSFTVVRGSDSSGSSGDYSYSYDGGGAIFIRTN